ncbi:hypothetical protein Tco_0382194 [Tanacetum coccineum]
MVVTESSGTVSAKQDECSRPRNDTDTDDADIKPVYDEEPMAEVQLTNECNIFALKQQHAEQPDLINKEMVDQDAEQCHDKRPLLAQLTENKKTELSNESLESENICLKKTVAHSNLALQWQKVSDCDNSGPAPQLQEVSPPEDKTYTTLQELELLFHPMYEEYFNAGYQSEPKSFTLSNNLQQHDTQLTLNAHPTLELIIPLTNVNAEENNNDQAEDAQFEAYDFINPFAPSGTEATESSSCNQWLITHGLKQCRKSFINSTNSMSGNLLTKPFGKTVINSKWLWKNKKDEDNTIIRNKARLVAKGYRQEEARRFVDPDHPEKVYYLRKALYGMKQASRALYDELSTFLISKGFSKGCLDTRKSNSVRIQFLGDNLISWMSKKQDCTTMSTAEAEYVALSISCAQVLWMRTQLKDYGFDYNKIPMYCDSQPAIAISCNPVQHSRTKHIDLSDMFTKALSKERFEYLVGRLGMRYLTPVELEPALRCLVKRTSKYSESNASALEDLTLRAGNPVKEVLLMNLPDHRLRRWRNHIFPAASYSLPHAHAQATKTYYKHQ